MRPTLPHPLAERPRPRVGRRKRRAARLQRAHRAAGAAAELALSESAVLELAVVGSPIIAPALLNDAVLEPLGDPGLFDPAVARACEAGGPVDRACYTCQCGYLFVAMVSTTVKCPHCGTEQAW
jgi:uncharacterized protein (DUF983 family)